MLWNPQKKLCCKQNVCALAHIRKERQQRCRGICSVPVRKGCELIGGCVYVIRRKFEKEAC